MLSVKELLSSYVPFSCSNGLNPLFEKTDKGILDDLVPKEEGFIIDEMCDDSIKNANELLESFVSGAYLSAAGGDVFIHLRGFTPHVYRSDTNTIVGIDGEHLNMSIETVSLEVMLAYIIIMALDDGRVSSFTEMYELYGVDNG